MEKYELIDCERQLHQIWGLNAEETLKHLKFYQTNVMLSVLVRVKELCETQPVNCGAWVAVNNIQKQIQSLITEIEKGGKVV